MLLELLVRPNIRDLKPYSSARDEYKGVNAEVFLDANENPYNQPFNRYPDPLQRELKDVISPIKQVPASNIFLGNGSDEPIDLLFRIFCRPQIDNVVAIAPTYGMYEVCANINDVEYRSSARLTTLQETPSQDRRWRKCSTLFKELWSLMRLTLISVMPDRSGST